MFLWLRADSVCSGHLFISVAYHRQTRVSSKVSNSPTVSGLNDVFVLSIWDTLLTITNRSTYTKALDF